MEGVPGDFAKIPLPPSPHCVHLCLKKHLLLKKIRLHDLLCHWKVQNQRWVLDARVETGLMMCLLRDLKGLLDETSYSTLTTYS